MNYKNLPSGKLSKYIWFSTIMTHTTTKTNIILKYKQLFILKIIIKLGTLFTLRFKWTDTKE